MTLEFACRGNVRAGVDPPTETRKKEPLSVSRDFE